MYNRSSRKRFFLLDDLKKVTVWKIFQGNNFIFLDYRHFLVSTNVVAVDERKDSLSLKPLNLKWFKTLWPVCRKSWTKIG